MIRRFVGFFAAACTLAAGIGVASARLPSDGPDRVEPRDPRAGRSPWSTGGSDPREQYDALHYSLDLAVDLETEEIDGTVAMTFVALSELTGVVVDCADNLTVSLARTSGGACTVTRLGPDQIECLLASPLGTGERDTLRITYRGEPGDSFLSGFRFFALHDRTEPVVQSLSVPDRAHGWWPCKDLLTDKATSETRITAPAELTCASNGLLQGRVMNGDGTATTHWRTAYPLVPYNVSFALAEYVEWTEPYLSPHHGRTIPIVNFVFREDSLDARADLSVTGEAMARLESLFGDYPFADPDPGVEKYGHAEVSWSSAMEHQTMTHLGSGFVNGRNTSDWAVAHELAHQWFGNSVSLSRFEDMWLNEGFATYCEALFAEGRGGLGAYRAWMVERRRADSYLGAVVDPIAIYGSTVYQKGAWVLHMLRGRLRAERGDAGDAEFREMLESYANHPDRRHGHTSTAAFIQHCEEATGEDLREFFDPWLYGEGRIQIEFDWSSRDEGSGARVFLHLAQTQPEIRYPSGRPSPASPEFYPTVWPLRAVSSAGDTVEFAVRQPEKISDLEHVLPFRPREIALDPDQWLLREIVPLAARDDRPSIEAVRPSVTATGTDLRYVVGPGGAVDLVIYDVRGRLVRRLVQDDGRPGRHWTHWDLREESGEAAASGVYFARAEGPGARERGERIIVRR